MSSIADSPPELFQPGRTRSRRRLILAASIAGGLAVAAGAGVWLAPRPTPAAVAATPSMTVTLGAPRAQVWTSTIQASGVVAPWQETIVASQIGGLQLREVHVNVGDRVRRGQILATFDPAAPRAELARLSAAQAQARAALAQAEANRARAETLAGSGAISSQEVLRYVTEADTARAVVQAADAASDAQREQLRYVQVRAPDDGVVTARIASPGAVGGVGQELFRIIRHSRLEWRGELTAAQLAQVAPGQTVEVALPDGSLARGRIRQTAPSLDQQTRLGLVYADLTSPGSARAGMYAAGSVRSADAPAVTVPASSVVLRDGHHYVFTVTSRDGVLVARARAVTVGRRRGDEVEILRGADRGSPVVVSGAGFLKDGDIVRTAAGAAGRGA